MVIVYFDGFCNVCNRFVDFLIRRDRRRRLRYAPLQGRTAMQNLPPAAVQSVSTMALQEGSRVSYESTAAIRSIALLGGVFWFVKLFLLIPRFARDFVYRWVADHRYVFAGRRETCRMPSVEEREMFLE